MSNEEIDARNVLKHLHKQSRMYAIYAVLMAGLLGVQVVLRSRLITGLQLDEMQVNGLLAVPGVLLFFVLVQCLRHSRLAQQVTHLIEKGEFGQVQNRFRTHLQTHNR